MADIYESIRNNISNSKFANAIKSLKGMSNRDGEWHYLYATASYGMGANVQAISHAKQACVLEPTIKKYSDLLTKMSFRDDRYRRERQYRSPRHSTCCKCCCCCCDCFDNDACDCLGDLWCADTMCECMGGDLCECM